ncbi:MAG: hypothetical protein F6K62_01580 [Sphaerospermopsis sp. SIO1G2]|nr:hypothetical protein [Sphaerospermopsis sp. SIO1G1]NET69771.1 hypothetical protein [Sphaerospermopsis sp. SIO1G2]
MSNDTVSHNQHTILKITGAFSGKALGNWSNFPEPANFGLAAFPFG